MVEFSVSKLLAIKKFGEDNVWCLCQFDKLESFYNSIFGTHLKSKCPACARGRYVDSINNWYKLGVKWLNKKGLALNEFGIPLGLQVKDMNTAQKSQYDSLSKAQKHAYKELSDTNNEVQD